MSDESDDGREDDLDGDDEDEALRELGGQLSDDAFMSAVVLHPKEPFLSWVRSIVPADEGSSDAVGTVVVLTPELPRVGDLESWLAQHHEEVFARQLVVWTEDESRWPEDLSLETLRVWFDVELTPAVDDMRTRDLLPDVTCEPISLKLLVAVFVGLPPGGVLYVDVRSGAVVGFSERDIAAMNAPDPTAHGLAPLDLEQMRRVYESATLVDVLGADDVDEHELMRSFADAQAVQGHQNRLLDALEGKKPARRFKNALEAAGLVQRWEDWQAAAVTVALRMALDERRIPWVDDVAD